MNSIDCVTASDRKFLSEREAAANAECFGCDFETRRRLLAFVFVLIYAEGNRADQVQGEIVVVGDFLGAAHVFDIGFQDAVEDGIVRQGILIFLIGAELSGGRP